MFGRADVELVAGVLVDLGRGGLDLAVERGVELFEPTGVEGHAGQFHLDEQGDQGQLQFPVEGGERLILLQLGNQHGGEAEGHVGVGGGVGARLRGRDIKHRLLLAALADQFLDWGHVDAEARLGEGLEPDLGLGEQIGDEHRVVFEAAQLDAVAGEDLGVELGVVQHLRH